MLKSKPCQIYLFFLFASILVSCNRSKKTDLSHIKLDIKIERFDHDLNALQQQNIATAAPVLEKKYGIFYNDYMSKMLMVGTTQAPEFLGNLQSVLKDKAYTDLTREVDSVYPNLQQTEASLTDAFKHIKYYYPRAKVPRFISFVSGFTVQTPIGNDYMGIGLDMFLGAKSKFYPALVKSIPMYMSKRFTPENIVPRIVEVYAHEELFPEADSSKNLLSKMIYNGKIMYFMDQVMPDVPDTLKIGYNTRQLEWCKKHEADIWVFFLDDELLYESDYMRIQKYLSDGPFTPGVGEKQEAAPKLGIWIGWQIVKRYMEKHPEVTLQQLMKQSDAQLLLTQSKYKPK